MKQVILLAMTVLLVVGLQAQTSVSIFRDTRAFNAAQVATGGNVTRGIVLSGFTDFYSTEGNDFNSSYSRYSLSHALPVEWLGLGGLGCFGKYEFTQNFAQPTQWHFGLSLQNDVNILGKQGWLLLCFSPINTVEKGQQFDASFNLPILDAFSITGFGDMSIVNGSVLWRLEPAVSANVEANMDVVAKYVKNSWVDNSDSWEFGLRFAF